MNVCINYSELFVRCCIADVRQGSQSSKSPYTSIDRETRCREARHSTDSVGGRRVEKGSVKTRWTPSCPLLHVHTGHMEIRLAMANFGDAQRKSDLTSDRRLSQRISGEKGQRDEREPRWDILSAYVMRRERSCHGQVGAASPPQNNHIRVAHSCYISYLGLTHCQLLHAS